MQTDRQSVPGAGSPPRSRRRGLRSAPAGDPGRCWGRASRWPVAGTAVSGVATMLLPLAAVFCRLASFWDPAACGASRLEQLDARGQEIWHKCSCGPGHLWFALSAWVLTFCTWLLMLQSLRP